MKNKVWKRLFMGSLVISAMAVPAQTAVGIQAEEETATLAENETDFQMLFDEVQLYILPTSRLPLHYLCLYNFGKT